MMLLWVIVLQTCFLSAACLTWSQVFIYRPRIVSDSFTPAEINDLCKNSFISDQLGYGYASKATCSRKYYQCTPSLNTYEVKLMYCSIKTVWDNLIYACVHPEQSTGGCTPTTCSGQKYEDNVYCNRYKECMADETIEDKCCPSGQKFDTVSSSCVTRGDSCTVDSSCYGNAQVSATCDKDKQPFLIADSNSCDSYSYCPWLVPNAQLQCCPGNLVWKQAIQSCAHPTAANTGCIRRCVNDVPSYCDFVEMRLCMPLTDSPKDYSRSRFAVTNHGVTFTTVGNTDTAYFDDKEDQLTIAGFKNLWNGNTPTDIQMTLALKIATDNSVNNNWQLGSKAKIISNGDCANAHSLAMYFELTDVSTPTYVISLQLADKTVTSQLQMNEGDWYEVSFKFHGSTGTVELEVNGSVESMPNIKVSFTNMKNPLSIGNSGCQLGTQANMYIRKVMYSEKHV